MAERESLPHAPQTPGMPTRRDVLRLATAAGLLASAPGCRAGRVAEPERAPAPAPPAPEPPAPALLPPYVSPLGDEYLARGLTALGDAHRRGWLAGHHGAAVLAACYFCRDQRVDELTARSIKAQVDGFIAQTPEQFPEPAPARVRAEPLRIVEQLDLHAHELRAGGHDTIYAALALRALHDVPELATPAVVEGVVQLLAAHAADRRPVAETEFQRVHPLPPYAGSADLAEATFRAALRPWDDVRRIGASGVLHWITHAEAIVTLEELGHADVARHAWEAHRRHVHRLVEVQGDARPARERIDWRATAYWASDRPRETFNGTWLAGHVFKLPYSAFRLARHVEDESLRDAGLVRAAELVLPFERG
jgi:hypothetical protein